MYNIKSVIEIRKILGVYCSAEIINIIYDYIWRDIELIAPVSINGAFINIENHNKKNSKYINIYSSHNVKKTNNKKFIKMNLKESQIPEFLEYVGHNKSIQLSTDLSHNKYRMLKSILGYHLNIDINKFDSKILKLSLGEQIMYKIPIKVPVVKPDSDDDSDKDSNFIISNSENPTWGDEEYVNVSTKIIKMIGNKKIKFDKMASAKYVFNSYRIKISIGLF